MNRIFLLIFCIFLMSFDWNTGHIRSSNIKRYVDNFGAYAVAQSKKSGIPASIIIAQAGIESFWGNSTLARKANNHFGIKCHNWNGEAVYRWDDERNISCFRSYESVKESFADHSKFLTSQPTKYKDALGCDWKEWAKVLQRDGYANNPNYFRMLNSIIKYNKLHELDKIQTNN